MVLVRRLDAEATALQRKGELGCGRRCSARRLPRSALDGRSAARPSSSRPTGSTAWPGAPGSTRSTADHLPRHWDDRLAQPSGHLPPVLLRDRHPDPARGRHGHGDATGRPWSATTTRKRNGASSSTSGTVRPARATSMRPLPSPLPTLRRSSFLPEQPVRDLRTDPASVTHRSTGGPPAKASPASASTATTSWPSWAVSEWALEHARSARDRCWSRPTPYRMGAHTTSDDPTKYRSGDELDAWRAKDPISRLRTYLSARA